jgi:hypothetical protein
VSDPDDTATQDRKEAKREKARAKDRFCERRGGNTGRVSEQTGTEKKDNWKHTSWNGNR